jgi:hypothetical protein
MRCCVNDGIAVCSGGSAEGDGAAVPVRGAQPLTWNLSSLDKMCGLGHVNSIALQPLVTVIVRVFRIVLSEESSYQKRWIRWQAVNPHPCIRERARLDQALCRAPSPTTRPGRNHMVPTRRYRHTHRTHPHRSRRPRRTCRIRRSRRSHLALHLRRSPGPYSPSRR